MRLVAGITVVIAALFAIPAAPYTTLALGVNDDDGTGGGGGGSGEERDADWYEDHPDWGEVYCTDPGHEGKPVPTSHWVRMRGYWLTADGEIAGGEVGPTPNFAEGIQTHQFAVHGGLNEAGEEVKTETFWMPIVTPDTVVYYNDLYAQVAEQLPDPTIEWKNKGLDYDWLWVRVEHFAGIEPIDAVAASATAGDDVTGRATAWVRATPTTFTLEIPGADDTEGVDSCDLEQAMSADGCRIRFVHASSIDPSGEFHGTMTVQWDVTSNSGKYDGQHITTEGEFSIVVAEAMAVSCPKSGCD